MSTAELPAAARARLADVYGERLRTDPADCLPYGYDNSRRVAMLLQIAEKRLDQLRASRDNRLDAEPAANGLR